MDSSPPSLACSATFALPAPSDPSQVEQGSAPTAGCEAPKESSRRAADTWRPAGRTRRDARRPPPAAAPRQDPGPNGELLARLLQDASSVEDRYRALFDSANDTITILSTEGIVLEANQRWEDVLKIPVSSVLGRHISEFAAPGKGAENAGAFSAILANGQGRVVATLQRGDGEPLLIEFSSRVVELDGRPVVLAIGHDVTESVNAALALKATEEKFRSLVERIPEVIWTMDAHGKLSYFTSNSTHLLTFGSEEVFETSLDCISNHIHPEDRDRVLEACGALLRVGTLFDIEYRRKARDGRWVWLRNRAFASYERDGTRYAEGMLSDITDRKQLEEELRQAQKMEAIGQLTGGIAHDFNNMLVAILANSHFLCEALADGDPRRCDAEEIKQVAERAAALTRQLLTFSRRQVLAPTIVDLNTSICGLQKMLRRLIGEDIDFSIVQAPDLASVRADAGQIEQILMNLAVNARDAMPSGGKLLIETANVELSDARAACHAAAAPGKYVVFTVTDTGVGMQAETKLRLFEPFFTTKDAGRGTGLGLSTCYGIVKQSGGWIDVESEPGRGAAFKVYLPAVDDVARVALDAPASLDFGGRETVLLIEDDDRVRAAVGRMLEQRGYSLLLARDGHEAIALAARHDGPIQLVVSDLIMPGPSGLETVSQVQAHRPQTKALFMSGYSDHVSLRRDTRLPPLNFIQKPFAPSALVKKVREALDATESACPGHCS